MKRTAIDESEHVATQCSDLRRTNPWLASYTGIAVRARRPTRRSRGPARSVRLWAGGLSAVLLTGAIAAGELVTGGATASSPSLDRYLATLDERATERKLLLTFGALPFSVDSAQIGDSEKSELVRMAEFLRAHPATIAQVVGYADDRGDATMNSRLAEQRAAAVRSYLVDQGIEPARLTVLARAGNRRVEILVQRSPMEPLR